MIDKSNNIILSFEKLQIPEYSNNKLPRLVPEYSTISPLPISSSHELLGLKVHKISWDTFRYINIRTHRSSHKRPK